MKHVNKLAAAVAVALSAGLVSPANAAIELKSNGRGDALLFPAFNGYVENYATISNNSNEWIQGHIRFRGAAWSAELLDFDVILSPGDVFVFRIADIDGDGQWEIDQSLDYDNFRYTGMPKSCNGNGVTVDKCIDASNMLEPPIPVPNLPGYNMTEVNRTIVQAVIEHQRHFGYIEFIAEGTLVGMTHVTMQELIGDRPLSAANAPYRTVTGNGFGTTLWAWTQAAAGFANGRGAMDAPNALSGTAFISFPGQGTGMAYNAEALVNFRTPVAILGDLLWNPTGCVNNRAYPVGLHRIDNYALGGANWLAAPLGTAVTTTHPKAAAVTGVNGNLPLCALNLSAENRAVILHDENANADPVGASPWGDYVYGWGDNDVYESRISFNNTWGPTLMDGDDHPLANNARRISARDEITMVPIDGYGDQWDAWYTGQRTQNNSLAEVEEAIRIGGQTFTSFYFDGDVFDKACQGNGTASRPACANATLKSFYLAHFPTKFYWGEHPLYWNQNSADTYLAAAVYELLRLGKGFDAVEVWDLTEQSCRAGENTSPRRPSTLALGHELSFFDIGFVKSTCPTAYKSGRVVMKPVWERAPSPRTFADATSPKGQASFPGLFYTFEASSSQALAHWRSMQR